MVDGSPTHLASASAILRALWQKADGFLARVEANQTLRSEVAYGN